jgi:hypothetical protein
MTAYMRFTDDELNLIGDALSELTAVLRRRSSALHATELAALLTRITDARYGPPEARAGTTPPTLSERGFKHFDPIPGTYGGDVRVYESSAADSPHVWVRIVQPPQPSDDDRANRGDLTVHLRLEDAALLREQLEYLVAEHYQVQWEREDEHD